MLESNHARLEDRTSPDVRVLERLWKLTECGPELNLSQYTSHDLRKVVEGIRRHAPLATFWWHWHGWGLSKMALIDHVGAKAALADPWVVNRDDVDIPSGE